MRYDLKKRLISILILLLTFAALIKIMVLKDVPMVRIGEIRLNFGGTHDGNPNLIPFKTIYPYMLGDKGWIIAGINLLGNIVLLVPIGFLIPFVSRKTNWKIMIIIAIISGLVIELLQTFLKVGIFDIDDVILNGIGVMIGYWVFLGFQQMINIVGLKIIIVFFTVCILLLSVLSGMYFHKNGNLPIGLEKAPNLMENSLDKSSSAHSKDNNDPCGGTGGIGPIIEKGLHTITIKRKDGVTELVKITDQTKLQNGAGTITESDLNIGDRVTVVVGLFKEDDKIASAVLVCNQSVTSISK